MHAFPTAEALRRALELRDAESIRAAMRDTQPRENTEIETFYRLKLTCRGEDENTIRGHLLDGVDKASLTLQGLWSEDTEDRRHADLITVGRQDREMEQVLRRLSREHGVSAISWETQSAEQ